MSKRLFQIKGYQINEISTKKKKSDPINTRFVMELSDGIATHRTCLDKDLYVLKDEIIDAPNEQELAEHDMSIDDFGLTIERK